MSGLDNAVQVNCGSDRLEPIWACPWPIYSEWLSEGSWYLVDGWDWTIDISMSWTTDSNERHFIKLWDVRLRLSGLFSSCFVFQKAQNRLRRPYFFAAPFQRFFEAASAVCTEATDNEMAPYGASGNLSRKLNSLPARLRTAPVDAKGLLRRVQCTLSAPMGLRSEWNIDFYTTVRLKCFSSTTSLCARQLRQVNGFKGCRG